jgi:SsrA-binding protein
MADRESIKVVADNRKAFHDYHIIERFETGIVLTGTEVKSIRAGKINLKDSYASVQNGEMWLIGTHVSPYEQGNRSNKDPLRHRKLLLHKNEILRLFLQVKQEGLTIVPLKCYFKRGRVKIEIALVKGKHTYDKREALSKRESQRDIERVMKNRARDAQ